MRILLHSNGPTAPTGYGVQTALLARRLRDAGHEVAISAYWGHQTGLGNWEGIPLLPCTGESYGNDLIHEHAIRWFDGDPLNGWIIPIMDVFGLGNPLLKDFNIAAWTPIDHDPVPDAVLKFFSDTDAIPIAMSKWGQELLGRHGLDALYAPLAVDLKVFSPVPDAKQKCGMDDDRFVVMMNGMNKGWAMHRKGYPEAFLAFGQFARQHRDALLYVHAEQWGQYAQGINLIELAARCGIGEDQIKFVDQYAYRCGFIPQEQLAAVYSAADVLLAPSRGEGFCIPLIEAQACGTPVIVTDFSAQPELVGAGWKLPAQPDWEAAQGAWMAKADIPAIMQALESAYEERGSELNRDCAIAKAREYDADLVFAQSWRPILEQMSGGTVVSGKAPIPKHDGVAVLVPVLGRPQNVAPLVESFTKSQSGVEHLYLVCDPEEHDLYAGELALCPDTSNVSVLVSQRGSTFAKKINSGCEQTTEPWLFVTGDDVRFRAGWIDAARKLSDRFDVIGTNDSADPAKGNARVQNGSHADHFFIRREYAEEDGGSLDGVICHEGYGHFYSDVEVIELAKARGVFAPCLASLVEHIHPDLHDVPVDDTYRLGWSQREADQAEWNRRKPLVMMQRQGLGKVRAA